MTAPFITNSRADDDYLVLRATQLCNEFESRVIHKLETLPSFPVSPRNPKNNFRRSLPAHHKTDDFNDIPSLPINDQLIGNYRFLPARKNASARIYTPKNIVNGRYVKPKKIMPVIVGKIIRIPSPKPVPESEASVRE